MYSWLGEALQYMKVRCCGVSKRSGPDWRELVQQMQFFARLEAYRLAGCDAYLCPSARVTSDPGLAGANIKYPKASELDAFSAGKSLLHAIKDGVDCCLGFGPWQPGTFYNTLDKVLLYQERHLLSCVMIQPANHR